MEAKTALPAVAPALLRRGALKAARGAALAIHGAAGLASPYRDAARLLRSAEGLVRAAAAILELIPPSGVPCPEQAYQPDMKVPKRKKKKKVAVLPSSSAAQSPQGTMAEAKGDLSIDADLEGGELGELVAQVMAPTMGPQAAVAAISSLAPIFDAVNVDMQMEGTEDPLVAAAGAVAQGGPHSVASSSAATPRTTSTAARPLSSSTAKRQGKGPWCSCGKKNSLRAWYCVGCGKQLNWEAQGRPG